MYYLVIFHAPKEYGLGPLVRMARKGVFQLRIDSITGSSAAPGLQGQESLGHNGFQPVLLCGL